MFSHSVKFYPITDSVDSPLPIERLVLLLMTDRCQGFPHGTLIALSHEEASCWDYREHPSF